jgi:hypothetical protein
MSRVTLAPTVGVCSTCPWRIVNQRDPARCKPHPAKWYKPANLRRLWNGIRTGKAPGMVCHSTDAESGSTKPAPKTATPRECGGVILLVRREVNILNVTPKFADYRAQRGRDALTRMGLAYWLNRHLFGKIEGRPIPSVTIDDEAAIGLPER